MKNPFSDHVFPAAVEKIQRQCREKFSLKGSEEMGTIPSKEEIWQVILDVHQTGLKNRDYNAYNWDKIVNEAANALGVRGNIDIEKLVMKNCNPPAVKGYEDGKELLEWLEEKKSVNEIAAITNGFNKYQAPVMQALFITMSLFLISL